MSKTLLILSLLLMTTAPIYSMAESGIQNVESSADKSLDKMTEAERRILTEMHRQLDALLQLCKQAKNEQQKPSRFPVNYDALQKDLLLIQLGIGEQLDIPIRSPRSLDSINGTYSRSRN